MQTRNPCRVEEFDSASQFAFYTGNGGGSIKGPDIMRAPGLYRTYRTDFVSGIAERRSCVAAAVAAVLISGCASTPTEPVSEKLDPDTATTVVVLNRPVELFSQTTRGAKTDPFAYIAPFETDRMGERALFLWVSAPQNAGPLTQPQILCNGEPLSLQPLSVDGSPGGLNGPPANSRGSSMKPDGSAVKVDLSQINLSHPPYDAPVPWSVQWYFRLPAEGLKCLAGAEGIALETRASDGDAERFTADRKNIASLDAFTHRY